MRYTYADYIRDKREREAAIEAKKAEVTQSKEEVPVQRISSSIPAEISEDIELHEIKTETITCKECDTQDIPVPAENDVEAQKVMPEVKATPKPRTNHNKSKKKKK